jgi:hypothetical protein
MKVGDLVRVQSHYKLEGCTGVITKIMGATSGVRARYVVTLTDGHTTWFYNNDLRGIS